MNFHAISRGLRAISTTLVVGFALNLTTSAHAQYYRQHNLVSDGFVPADTTDPNLVNPWGLAASGSGPFWIADNGTGLSTVYNTTGGIVPLVVTIPPAGSGVPDGIVFNGTTDFKIAGVKASFIFSGEDGTISGWNGGTNAATTATVAGAVFKGLALGNNGGANQLYAADFAHNSVDVFDSSFAAGGAFADASVDAGFSPFNVANIGGKLYVSFAKKKDGTVDDEAGPGNGYIDVFNMDGTLDHRLVSHGALNSPWGMVKAPSSGFGLFNNALLVGNFGDGTINAFDSGSGNFLGTLKDNNGNPIVIDGLWGLMFGNGGSGGDKSKLYFTAGLNGESDGLFGSLQAVPEPSVVVMLTAGLLPLLRRRRK